jgi:hypothetical protein
MHLTQEDLAPPAIYKGHWHTGGDLGDGSIVAM